MDKIKNEVKLKVEDKVFTVGKDMLKKNSAYFEAMFSGRFKEEELDEIKIEMISSNSMQDILNFMKYGFINMENIRGLSDIIRSASFLQIQRLIPTIEQYLMGNITLDNWIDIYEMAEESELESLKFKAKCFGLIKFDHYEEIICNIKDKSRLLWYLSHCNLNVTNEYDVFEAGCKWIQMHMNKDCVSLLEIIYCIDTANLSVEDYQLMLNNELVLNDTLVEMVLNYLKEKVLCTSTRYNVNDSDLFDDCNDTIKHIIDMLRQARRKRKLVQRPCIIGRVHNEMHSRVIEFDPLASKMVLGVEIEENSMRGYSVTSWLGHKVVVVGGKNKYSGYSSKRVRIYDTLHKSWTTLNYNVWPRTHTSIAVKKNKLYILGGIGHYGLTPISMAEKYDLLKDEWQYLPSIPKQVVSPAVTIHKDNLYVACEPNIYVLHQNDEELFWEFVLETSNTTTKLVSVGDSIFMGQHDSNQITSFHTKLHNSPMKREKYNFNHFISAMCKVGNEIYAFTITPDNKHCVEKCNLERCAEECGKAELLWSDEDIDPKISFYPSAGCFTLSYCDKEDSFLRQW